MALSLALGDLLFLYSQSETPIRCMLALLCGSAAPLLLFQLCAYVGSVCPRWWLEKSSKETKSCPGMAVVGKPRVEPYSLWHGVERRSLPSCQLT